MDLFIYLLEQMGTHTHTHKYILLPIYDDFHFRKPLKCEKGVRGQTIKEMRSLWNSAWKIVGYFSHPVGKHANTSLLHKLV